MFGYATDETEECMPLTVVLAHKLNEKIAQLRRSGELWWARPDTKTQVRRIGNWNFIFAMVIVAFVRPSRPYFVLVSPISSATITDRRTTLDGRENKYG